MYKKNKNKYTESMFSIVLRTLFVIVGLLFGMRVMGKRTIGELQPYEFVITLAVADLACMPMQDVSVPLLYGVVPITVLIVFHFLVTVITSKSIKFRKFLNGKPFIVITEEGIDSAVLEKLNLSVNDLLELIRQQGYFSIPEISYGIIETNGKLSVMENENTPSPSSVPISLVMEGKIIKDNLTVAQVREEDVNRFLKKQNMKLKEVLLLTKDGENIFLQPKNQKYRTANGL